MWYVVKCFFLLQLCCSSCCVGDLNYRIDVLREEAFKMINQRKWTELWEKDQLRREMEVRTHCPRCILTVTLDSHDYVSVDIYV